MMDDLISRKSLLKSEGAITMTNREAYERDCEELEQYRAIGTVEECRKAVEKQKAKKPRDIEYDYSYFVCPNCGDEIYVTGDFESHKYCLNCGQAIQWVNENLEGMEDE